MRQLLLLEVRAGLRGRQALRHTCSLSTVCASRISHDLRPNWVAHDPEARPERVYEMTHRVGRCGMWGVLREKRVCECMLPAQSWNRGEHLYLSSVVVFWGG